ncbi:MAG: ribonuclease J [Alphaproteobacteria bacterium]|nr:ribonuclease J [Alphaproteobacteria bacterium]
MGRKHKNKKQKAEKTFSVSQILKRSKARKDRMSDKKFVENFNRQKSFKGENDKVVSLDLPSNFSLEKVAEFKRNFKINQGPEAEKSETLYFTALGGMVRIGKNCYAYGYKGKWIIVDIGMFVPDQREEPNVERIVPDPAFIRAIKKDIVGIVITHTHWDHLGGVVDLWPEIKCPIYCSPIVEKVLLMIQKQTGKENRFTLPIKALPKGGGKFKAGPFNLEAVHLTHSVLEAYGLAIYTGNGIVFHTGDFKVDETPLIGETTNFKRLEEMKKEGVLAVVSDSTNAIDGLFTKSEKVAREEVIKVVKGIKTGRVFMTCFSTSMVRMETAYLAAKEAGRTPYLVGASLERMFAIYKELGYLKDIEFENLKDADSTLIDDDKVLYLCTGTQAEPFSAMTRLSQGRFRGLETKPGDTALFSARIIPGNEKYVNRVHDNYAKRGVHVISTNENPDIHASGHPAKKDLIRFYEALGAKHIIPMHGTYSHLKHNYAIVDDLKKAHKNNKYDGILLGNGDLIEITKDKLEIVAEVPEGDVYIEPFRKFVAGDKVVANRKKAHFNGTLFVSFPMDRKGKVSGKVQVSSVALAETEDMGFLIEGIKQLVKATVGSMPSDKISPSNVEKVVGQEIKRYVNRMIGRKPIIALHIFKSH